MNLKKWIRNKGRGLHLAWLGRYGAQCRPIKWVFIVGCYNSGTTLLHDILAQHEKIAHLPREGQYCTDQFVIPSAVGLTRAWALKPELFIPKTAVLAPDAKIVQRQWCSLAQPASRPLILEKSIPNAARIQWLNEHFQQACFIALVRNGYAVAEGIRRKAGQPLEVAACQWQRSNQIMLEQLEQVPRQILLTYEELTQHPAATLQRVLKFLDLPPMPELARREFTVHGMTSPVRNMNERSLKQLSEQDYRIIEQQAWVMLEHFGYLRRQDD